MRIESPEIPEGGAFPVKYTRDGEDASPPVRWRDVPEKTRSLALVFESTTPMTKEPAPKWVVYDIPPNADGLPEDLTRTPELEEPVRAKQAKNHEGTIGYSAPLGVQDRPHRYRFRLLALDEPLGLEPGADAERVLEEAERHVIGEAALDVEYTRPRS